MRPQAEASYRWLFWCLALVGLALDQGSKYVVFHALYPGGLEHDANWIPGVFELTTRFQERPTSDDGLLSPLRSLAGDRLAPQVNTGALFGFGKDANLVFALVSVAAAGAILAWSLRPGSSQDRFLSVALGLILAGTLGNLYDRVVFGGVRDFLHWYKWIDWPVFNLADCCLVCGAGLLLVQAFGSQPETGDQPLAAEEIAGIPEVAEAK